MSGQSNQKKADALGMTYGKACHKLQRQLLLHLASQLDLARCHVCGTTISTVQELSIEHKDPWLNHPELFWDLDNVAFSHLRCNRPHVYGQRQSDRRRDDGKWLCTECKQYLDEDAFSFYTPSATRKERRPRSRCKLCRTERRKLGLTF